MLTTEILIASGLAVSIQEILKEAEEEALDIILDSPGEECEGDPHAAYNKYLKHAFREFQEYMCEHYPSAELTLQYNKGLITTQRYLERMCNYLSNLHKENDVIDLLQDNMEEQTSLDDDSNCSCEFCARFVKEVEEKLSTDKKIFKHIKI